MLAGGQSLVPMLKLRFASPELLVDINDLPGLGLPPGRPRRHHPHRRAVPARRPGALDRSSPPKQPTMAAAAPLVADPIVRNRGTLVGSLCHADPQGDWASVVTALGGHVVAQGTDGRRKIPVAEFVTGPFQNVLAYDEIAVEAVIPAPKGTVAGGYLKLERRVGDFATAGVAVARRAVGRPSVTRAGHRPDRRRRLDHRRHRRRPGPGGRAADRRQHRAGRRPGRAGRPAAAPTTAAAPSTSGTSCAPSSSASSPASTESTGEGSLT